MTPTIRYPTNPVTPHGAYLILRDRVPRVNLLAYDGSIVFEMMGGLAIADRQTPERVEITGLKGLIPPWQTIDQKGATQDGTTFIDALYDPIEAELELRVKGRDPRHTRQVYNHLIASLDAKKTSEFAWWTHEMGRWWAPVRWFSPPVNETRITGRTQDVSIRVRADSGFWQSYPDVDEFRFSYGTASNSTDTFSVDDADDLGTGWTIGYTGGSGIIFVDNGQVESTLNGRTAAARRVGYTSTSNNQVIEIEIGSIAQWFYPTNAYNDIWVLMANTGTPGANGVRVRLGRHTITVSSFNSGTETVLRQQELTVPPMPGDKFTVIANGDTRSFKVLRGGATLLNFKETGTTSQVGASFRSAGLGLAATSSVTPAGIRSWTAGDNTSGSRSGFLRRINAGDQDMWDRYTCFGPGLFRFGNGPGSSDMVEFGPLLPNQVAQIRTDPRKRGVVDMTATPATPQEQAQHESSLLDFLSFATGNNTFPLLGIFQSIFGFLGLGSSDPPPQGNLYSLLKGRFSNPIPAKSPGNPAQEYYVKVEIEDGNADSKVIAAGTPLRRNPY